MIRHVGLLLGLIAQLFFTVPPLWAQNQISANLLSPERGGVLLLAPADPNLALSLTDGDGTSLWSVADTALPPPYRFVFEMLAPARLSQVGAIGTGENQSGSARIVRIEASATGPDGPYVPLATLMVATQGRTLVDVIQPERFRWLRYTLQNAQSKSAAPIYLGELIALGTPAPPQKENRFTGTFQTGYQDRLSLQQDGTALRGCYLENGGRTGGTLSGTVHDGVAHVNWSSDQGTKGTALFTRDSTGALWGIRYRQRNRLIWGGPEMKAETATPACEIERAASISASADQQVTNPILQALDSTGVARIYGIRFRYGRDTPDSSSQPALQQLLAALTGAPDLALGIEGHTDADGSDAYNLALSQRRAEAVVDWLVSQGVSADRLTALGKGESEPVASNATRDGKALNRRVELRKR